MEPVTVHPGNGPIVLGFPHAGTYLPAEMAADLNETGRSLTDTDWHVDCLYDGLLPSATHVVANFHRYVIDANRDPDGTSLYPGQATTGLVPTTDFDGRPLRSAGSEIDDADIRARIDGFHAPYHAALASALARARDAHGIAILYDCHSIRSEVPRLFEGRLPDLNVGTFDGRTCAPTVESAVADILNRQDRYTTVSNGRFRGGWTTRHYGRPTEGTHALQMEIAQRTYMNEAPPWTYDETQAAPLRTLLAEVLGRLDHLARSGDLERTSP